MKSNERHYPKHLSNCIVLCLRVKNFHGADLPTTYKRITVLFAEFMEKHNLRGSLRQRVVHHDLYKIRTPYRQTVALWQSSVDLLRMFDNNLDMMSRHQRVIKEEYGINIFAPHPGEIGIQVELDDLLMEGDFTYRDNRDSQ